MKPIHSILFMIAVMGLLSAVSLLIPEDGITLNRQFNLQFPQIGEMLSMDSIPSKTKDEILNKLTAVDTIPDSIPAENDEQKPIALEYPEGDSSILYPFFQQLERAGKKQVRIMHFGDSQIEGDRMTSYIRNQLQSRFGGSGPGLVSLKPLVPSFSVRQTRSDNWMRFTAYGKKDSTVYHRNYGVMATFSRYIPVYNRILHSDARPGRLQTAWVKFTQPENSYTLSRSYDRMRLFYGNSSRRNLMKVLADGSFIKLDTLEGDGEVHLSSHHFKQSPEELTLFFKGKDSPDFYGISLDSKSGITMDNISWRGSSGTLFKWLSGPVFEDMLRELNPSLFVLQFGGNAVPAIDNMKEVESYGRNFGRQIEYLRSLLPEAGFIVIGPADMSENVNGEMRTREFLVPVRNAIREASLNNGAAFFDLFEAMGGRNSMPVWVENDLAVSDYVHLQVEGAKILSEAFYRCLIRDYLSWKKMTDPDFEAVKEEEVLQ